MGSHWIKWRLNDYERGCSSSSCSLRPRSRRTGSVYKQLAGTIQNDILKNSWSGILLSILRNLQCELSLTSFRSRQQRCQSSIRFLYRATTCKRQERLLT